MRSIWFKKSFKFSLGMPWIGVWGESNRNARFYYETGQTSICMSVGFESLCCSLTSLENHIWVCPNLFGLCCYQTVMCDLLFIRPLQLFCLRWGFLMLQPLSALSVKLAILTTSCFLISCHRKPNHVSVYSLQAAALEELLTELSWPAGCSWQTTDNPESHFKWLLWFKVIRGVRKSLTKLSLRGSSWRSTWAVPTPCCLKAL